jgi:hypothetical protein
MYKNNKILYFRPCVINTGAAFSEERMVIIYEIRHFKYYADASKILRFPSEWKKTVFRSMK